MVLLLQITGQVAEIFLHVSNWSKFSFFLLGVLDPVDAIFDTLERPRLQEHGDRLVVRAKQYQEDLEEIVLLLTPITRLFLDHRHFSLLETLESCLDLIKVVE